MPEGNIVDFGRSSAQSGPLVRFGDQPLVYPTLSGDYHERARRVCMERLSASESFHKSRYERFYRWERLYHMISRKKSYDWKANVFLPYGFAVAEQSAAIKWLALMLTRPYVSVRARRAGQFRRDPDMPDLDEVARRRETLLDWHFTGDIDLIEVVADMLRLSERYGKAIAMVTPDWKSDILKYRKKTDLPTELGPISRLEWKMKSQREMKIGIHVLDLTDCLPQPGKRLINGTGPQAMDWMGHTSWMTLDELFALEKHGDVGTAVGGEEVANVRSTQVADTSEYKLRRMFLGQDDAEMYRDPFARNVEISHYSGLVPDDMIDPNVAQMEEADGLNPKKRILMFGNKQTVLMNRALPWDHGMKPYVGMDCVTDPYDFWGKGKMEPAEHINYAANEVQNSRLDNVKMVVNRLIGVDSTKMPAGWKEKLISQPFGVIPTNAPPAQVLHALPLGDVTQSSYTEQQQLWTLAQEATAINETLIGGPGPERTLGEHQLKAESSSKRIQFELVIQSNQLLGFKSGLSRFIIALDRQYLPIPTYLRVIDPDSPDDMIEVSIRPEDLADDDELFTYAPTGSTEGINLAQKRQDLLGLFDVLKNFGPAAFAMGMDASELLKTTFRTFGFDPNRFFPKKIGIADVGQATGASGAGMPGAMPGGPAGAGMSGEQKLAAIRSAMAGAGMPGQAGMGR